MQERVKTAAMTVRFEGPNIRTIDKSDIFGALLLLKEA